MLNRRRKVRLGSRQPRFQSLSFCKEMPTEDMRRAWQLTQAALAAPVTGCSNNSRYAVFISDA